MDEIALMMALRTEIGDKEKPYRYEEAELLGFIQGAISNYALFRPSHKRAVLTLQPGVQEYPLPEDFQTWTRGLEEYEVLDKTLYLDYPVTGPINVRYTYLGGYDISSMPEGVQSIIIDYCMWKLLSDAVREGSEISELKLGKGLDIKFDNFDQINELADKRYKSYLAAVQRPIGGGT